MEERRRGVGLTWAERDFIGLNFVAICKKSVEFTGFGMTLCGHPFNEGTQFPGSSNRRVFDSASSHLVVLGSHLVWFFRADFVLRGAQGTWGLLGVLYTEPHHSFLHAEMVSPSALQEAGLQLGILLLQLGEFQVAGLCY